MQGDTAVGITIFGARLFQQRQQRRDIVPPRAHQFDIAAGDGQGDGIGAGFDPVRHDGGIRAMQSGDAFDHQL